MTESGETMRFTADLPTGKGSMEERPLRRGDVVEVKSAAEILATLDASGTLEEMPFMPEMARFCGKRFTVDRRADKVCDTSHWTGSRRVQNAVLLDNLRCDGSAHGGCQAECRPFWKEAWLRRVDVQAKEAPQEAPGDDGQLIQLTVRNARNEGNPPAWRCQATELHDASERLNTFDPRPWVREYTTRNVELPKLLRVLARAAVHEPMRKLGLLRQVPLRGRHTTTPPETPLHLQPGELVEVRGAAELADALTVEGRNRGLWFDREMLPYCGKRFRVRQRIRRFLDERTGQMIELKTDCVSLEGAVCAGEFSTRRWLCSRAIYPYWRESWLRRVEEPAPATISEHGD